MHDPNQHTTSILNVSLQFKHLLAIQRKYRRRHLGVAHRMEVVDEFYACLGREHAARFVRHFGDRMRKYLVSDLRRDAQHRLTVAAKT